MADEVEESSAVTGRRQPVEGDTQRGDQIRRGPKSDYSYSTGQECRLTTRQLNAWIQISRNNIFGGILSMCVKRPINAFDHILMYIRDPYTLIQCTRVPVPSGQRGGGASDGQAKLHEALQPFAQSVPSSAKLRKASFALV